MVCCCFSVAKLCPTLCDPVDCIHQASLSFSVFHSLLKLMSIQLVMLSNHLILWCRVSFCVQSFPAWGSFPMSWLFPSGGQSIRASALASVLPMNNQDWFPLGLTDLISLLFKGLTLKSLLHHHSSKASTLRPLSLLYGPTLTSIHWKKS